MTRTPRFSAALLGAGLGAARPRRPRRRAGRRHELRAPAAAGAGGRRPARSRWSSSSGTAARTATPSSRRSRPGRRSCRPTWCSGACRSGSARSRSPPSSASSTRWRRSASLPTLHRKVFSAIHNDRARLRTPEDMAAFALKNGVDPIRVHDRLRLVRGAGQVRSRRASSPRPTRSTACRRWASRAATTPTATSPTPASRQGPGSRQRALARGGRHLVARVRKAG